MKAFKYSTPVACSQKSYEGFALIAALSLMAFILILMISLSAMVRVDYRASTSSVLQAEAKQNALLGLYQALGTLQEELGPDQRISANADILNSSNGDITAGDNALSVANPYLTGVWDSSGDKNNETLEARRAALWSPGEPIDYATRGSLGFRRWLISTPGNSSASASTSLGGFDPKELDAATNTIIRDDENPDVINLLGAGTLQPNANKLSASDLSQEDRARAIWAPLVPIENGNKQKSAGRMAWVVLDEGVKARFNLPTPEVPGTTAERLLAWDKPGDYGIENIGRSSGTFASYPDIRDQVLKTTAFEDAAALLFYNGADRDILGSYVHDITLHSTSVLSNVVDGGLKRDLALLADERPAAYTNPARYLYADQDTPLGGSTAAAEPVWPYLLDYVNLYKDSTRLQAGNAPLELPFARTTQTNWEGSAPRTPYSLPLPARRAYELAPTITKVEFYISMLGTKPLPPGANDQFHHQFYRTDPGLNPSTTATAATIAANRPLALGVIVAPVLTLHNPYNIPIEFDQLWAVLRDPPIGFRIARYPSDPTGTPIWITDSYTAISQMFLTWTKVQQVRFVMQLTGENGPTRLMPGQSLVFSPSEDQYTTLNTMAAGFNNSLFRMVGRPGYEEGKAPFYQALTGSETWNNANKDPISITGYVDDGAGGTTQQTLTMPVQTFSSNGAQIGLITGESVQVAINLTDGTQNGRAIDPDGSDNPVQGIFPVELYADDPQIGGTLSQDQSASTALLGRYVFDYNTGAILSTGVATRQDLLEESSGVDGPSYAADAGVIVKERLTYAQLASTSDYGTVNELQVDELTPLPIAVVRFGGKVTQAGTSIAAPEFHPAIPWAQTNPGNFSGRYDVGEESSAYSHFDFSITGTDQDPNIGLGPDLGPYTEGYAFSGYAINRGVKRASIFEVPLTPLQSIASLQHANLASSGYLPQVSHVVGNSWAHPLLPADAATGSKTNGINYTLLDHSFIANARLWDRFYFSTLSDQRSVYNPGGAAFPTVFENWLNGLEPAPNPLLRPYLPDGRNSSEALADILAGTSPQSGAYAKVAAYQLLEGGFNINSTSVEAWKAILSAHNLSQGNLAIPTYEGESTAELEFSTSSDPARPIAFSRFRIPNSKESFDATDNETTRWQGYRELSLDEIDRLAEEIVKQIRYRGPFLSLADFVNRRLSDTADPRSLNGVIAAAIEASGINEPVTNSGPGVVISDYSSHLEEKDFDSTRHAGALAGNSLKGTPTYLTQADILQQIGPKLTPRSDTFVIRAYGESSSGSNGEVARSFCEAVVQRLPDYVDPGNDQYPYFDSDPTTPEPDGLSEINERFGRKFRIVQIRWLNPDSI